MDEPGGAAPVHVTRIDVPFLDLVAFFVKASFAGAIAFLVTSWLWVLLATGVGAASAGLLVLAGVPRWLAPPAPVEAPRAEAPPPPAAAAPAPPSAAVVVLESPREAVPPPVEVGGPTPADAAATEAAQLAEIERMRRERARRP